MPTYDYECLKCARIFEVFQPITADPIKRCEKCKGKVKRLIGGGSGLIFKGSGFYETDYKRKSSGKITDPSATDKKSSSADKKTSD